MVRCGVLLCMMHVFSTFLIEGNCIDADRREVVGDRHGKPYIET